MARLLVCSHRGPVAHELVDGSVIQRPAGPGGLVAAMLPVLARSGATWMFAPATDADRVVARTRPEGFLASDGLRLRILDLPREAHRDHYEVVSNDLLARLFHYLFRISLAPDFDSRLASAWDGYRRVNEAFGEGIRTTGQVDAVLVEDIHLMLAGAAARAGGGSPGPPLHYFHHMPWCAPDYFGLLPVPVREEILGGLLACDSVGFHCRRWVDAFVACCERFLPGAAGGDAGVSWRGRSVPVVVAPAPVDVESVRSLVDTDRTRECSRRFAETRGRRKLLVRVDRADLWKNVLRGLSAYRQLLERRPEAARETWFLALLSPTRMWIPEYRDYLAACVDAADAINADFAAPGGRDVVTIDLPAEGAAAGRHRALGALAIADAVLVNSLFDGLNLVAKEAVIAGRPDMVLILSENAGAIDELGAHALVVNPFDTRATSSAVERALSMPDAERRARAAGLREIVGAGRAEDWIARRLASNPG